MSFQTKQSMSLMIPRVFPQWIDEQKIIKVFHDQQIGRIFKVSIKRLPDERGRDHPIYQAFLYFSVWYDNEIAYNLQQRLLGSKKQARVVYDDPWYWVLFVNKSARLNRNELRQMRTDKEVYLNEMIMFEHLVHHQELIQAQERQFQVQQNQLLEQQRNMEHLQRFCIQRGLNVPFWDPTNPPADADIDMELAETAVRVAEAVLQYDNTDDMNLDTQYTAQGVAEYVLQDDGTDDMNLETSQLAQEMTELVLDEQDRLCVCEACVGGEEFYIQEARRNIILSNPA